MLLSLVDYRGIVIELFSPPPSTGNYFYMVEAESWGQIVPVISIFCKSRKISITMFGDSSGSGKVPQQE